MEVLKAIGGFTLIAIIWMAIPAALLYPIASWAAAHTAISMDVIENSYVLAVAVLFLPAGFLVDFLYRKVIRRKHFSKRFTPHTRCGGFAG